MSAQNLNDAEIYDALDTIKNLIFIKEIEDLRVKLIHKVQLATVPDEVKLALCTYLNKATRGLCKEVDKALLTLLASKDISERMHTALSILIQERGRKSLPIDKIESDLLVKIANDLLIPKT